MPDDPLLARLLGDAAPGKASMAPQPAHAPLPASWAAPGAIPGAATRSTLEPPADPLLDRLLQEARVELAPPAPRGPAVVDDPSRALPLRALAGASFRTGPEEQIEALVRETGMPRSRFGTDAAGNIVFRDDSGDLVRATPSVRGATGVLDAMHRLAGWAAANLGDLAGPTAGGILGGLLGGGPASIATAGGGAAVGEAARQMVGDLIYGDAPVPEHVGRIVGEGAMGGVGQGAGLLAGRLAERTLFGSVLSAADRDALRNPATRAEVQSLAENARRRGVTLLSGDVSDRRSLMAADRQLTRRSDTADAMRQVLQRRNLEEVPGAAINMARTATGGLPESIDAGARNFSRAAGDIIDQAQRNLNFGTRSAFQRAYQAQPGPLWSETLEELMQRPAVAQAWREAQERAANAGRPLPPLFRVQMDQQGNAIRLTLTDASTWPDLQAWHHVKVALDRMARGGIGPAGELRGPNSSIAPAARALREELIRLTGGPGRSPYEAALRQYQQQIGPYEALRDALLPTAERGMGPADAGLDRLLSADRASPELIRQMRDLYVAAGREREWNQGVAAWLLQKINDAQRAVVNQGNPGNVAGRLYQSLFRSPQHARGLAAALGGPDSPGFREVRSAMDVLRAAARTLPEGSPTATDLGADQAFAGLPARIAAGAARATGPWNWPQMLSDAILSASSGRNAQRVVQSYLAGPQANASALLSQRLLPSGVVGGLLPAAGQLGARGLLGPLLMAPSGGPAPGRRAPP